MSDTPHTFQDADYISDELKKHSKPLYLCSLYFDEDKRRAARAIYCFYTELRKIPETISEPMLGEIRTTWWRDTIESADIEKAGSPLAREILSAISDHDMDKNLFFALLEGITSDLYVQLYDTWKEIETYLEATSCLLFAILGDLAGLGEDQACIPAGRAFGLAQALYETPISLQHHKHYFSGDTLKNHDLSVQSVLERTYTAQMRNLYKTFKSNIFEELGSANSHLKSILPKHKAGFTTLALIKPWLTAIDKTENPLSQIAPLSPLGFQWHLWKSAKKGQF